MVLESTMLCVDNSEFMRNGDFTPNRLQAEQDAVNLICQCKLRLHPENNVGLLTTSQPIEVLSTLTQDTSKIFMKMHQVQPKGDPNFLAALRTAHLALKHRQGRNHKTRIIVFVGSPLGLDKAEFVKLAKRFKKEKVNVDVINFGQEDENLEALKSFIETLNGKDGTGSHLVTVPAGSAMSEALLSSPVLRSEDGSAPLPGVPGAVSGFGVDPNEDPELALALRVSMEEQRARQEEEARRTQADLGADSAAAVPPTGASGNATAGSAPAATSASTTGGSPPNVDAMTEEEQIAWALQMSLAGGEAGSGSTGVGETTEGGPKKEEETPMDVDTPNVAASSTASVSTTKDKNIAAGAGTSVDSSIGEDQNEFADLLTDPAALEDLVKTLPGVDPNSKEVQESIASIKKESTKEGARQAKEDDSKKKKEEKKPEPKKD